MQQIFTEISFLWLINEESLTTVWPYYEKALQQAGYDDWVKQVVTSVPEDRILIINVKHEWEGLCKFLDVPIPDVPYPKIEIDDSNIFASHDTHNVKSSKFDIETPERAMKPYSKDGRTSRMLTYSTSIAVLFFLGYLFRRRKCNKCILYSMSNHFKSLIDLTLFQLTNFSFQFGI